MKLVTKILSSFIYCGIYIYQRLLKPFIKALSGPNSGCRFYPSCSNYFLQAVQTHGPFYGSWLGTCRICRCHPWGKCGEDHVPPKKHS